MTQQEMRDRMQTIVSNFHGNNKARPLCNVLEDELDVQPSDEFDGHEYVHAFINSLAVAAVSQGATDPGEVTMLAFSTGRKWGLIEATAAMDSLDNGTA